MPAEKGPGGAERGMEGIILVLGALSAAATTIGVTMRARYRHKSVKTVVRAWCMKSEFDLPTAIGALNRRGTVPGEAPKPSVVTARVPIRPTGQAAPARQERHSGAGAFDRR